MERNEMSENVVGGHTKYFVKSASSDEVQKNRFCKILTKNRIDKILSIDGNYGQHTF